MQEWHAHNGWRPSMRGGTSAYPERCWVLRGLMRHPTGMGLSMGGGPRRVQEDPPLQYHREDITAELTPVLDGRTPVYPPPLVRHSMRMSPPAMPPLRLCGLVAETEGKDQDATIIDESTGNPPEDLGDHLTKCLTETFAPEEVSTPQDGRLALDQSDSNQEENIGRGMVLRALARLKGATYQGLNGVPASVLKSLREDAVVQLADIFTAILRGEEPVPQDWRVRREVLTPNRGGDKHFLKNYRPPDLDLYGIPDLRSKYQGKYGSMDRRERTSHRTSGRISEGSKV
ncbi:hypothetical protein HPB47_016653 [Ixodes persulcatus]|uniref:Uncharacterized protein n=1 Tax=Ixodes persulcatus TaxID=34615 RepID=A0AC60QQE1_IXOPE|nr:hypothetical protein HPB47_016653 [Ixodes persulcatus]